MVEERAQEKQRNTIFKPSTSSRMVGTDNQISNEWNMNGNAQIVLLHKCMIRNCIQVVYSLYYIDIVVYICIVASVVGLFYLVCACFLQLFHRC